MNSTETVIKVSTAYTSLLRAALKLLYFEYCHTGFFLDTGTVLSGYRRVMGGSERKDLIHRAVVERLDDAYAPRHLDRKVVSLPDPVIDGFSAWLACQ